MGGQPSGPPARAPIWTFAPEGVRRIFDLGAWTGLAIGGLSVGEPKAVIDMLERSSAKLPALRVIFLMGVGSRRIWWRGGARVWTLSTASHGRATAERARPSRRTAP